MASSTRVKFTMLALEWGSKHGGLSTLNRVLAIELAKHPKVHVSVFVPRCNQKEANEALRHNITLVQAPRRDTSDEIEWLSVPPEDLQIDIVIGHGVKLGRKAHDIRERLRCKWIQFVHTDPGELGMFKGHSNPVAKGEQSHQTEVQLCEMADFVVTVGPKLGEAYRSYLRHCKKGQKVFVLTPGIFNEFSTVEQATQDGGMCRVLAFGRGDMDEFSLKGFDIAAKAVAELHDANLILVGVCNKKQDEFARNLKQFNIPSDRLRVRAFLESRDDLKKLFCEADLVIMPSRTEGFGLGALEALSAGLPILVGANSGFGIALSKVAFGSSCVIKSKDPVIWTEAIRTVWNKDRELRLEESDTLREGYAKKYNWEKQCNDLVEIARSIVTDASDEEESSTRKQTKKRLQSLGAPNPKRPKGTKVKPIRRQRSAVRTRRCAKEEPHLKVVSRARPAARQPTPVKTRSSTRQERNLKTTVETRAARPAARQPTPVKTRSSTRQERHLKTTVGTRAVEPEVRERSPVRTRSSTRQESCLQVTSTTRAEQTPSEENLERLSRQISEDWKHGKRGILGKGISNVPSLETKGWLSCNFPGLT